MAVEKHHLFKFHIVNMLLLCFTSSFKLQMYIYFHVSKYICSIGTMYLYSAAKMLITPVLFYLSQTACEFSHGLYCL